MPQPALPKGRLFARAIAITLLFVGHGVRWLVGSVALRFAFAGRARRRTWFGQCVLDLFRGLGATFVKVGQIMSTRPDLLPDYVTRALERLQDDVGPFPYDAVVRTIEEDLGRRIRQIFAEFAPVPLASASVAQVHKARLPDGRVVAVKVRRPGVVELCAFDLAVMRFAARQLGRLPSLRQLDPEGAVAQFARSLQAQVDFRVEADNNRRFQRNFAGDPNVTFPDVVDELSTSRVLVMSFVEGTKILSVGRTNADPKRIARIGLQAMLKMIFADGFVHADLHPGNIFVTHDGRIALLDLGLVGELDDDNRKGFARFFAAWAMRDGDTMARLMLQMAQTSEAEAAATDPDAYERYRAAIIEFVGRYWGQRVGDVQVGRVLLDLLGILRRHRIRMKPTFTTVNIAIAMTEGIGKQLDPELDLMAEALPYFLAHPVDAAGVG